MLPARRSPASALRISDAERDRVATFLRESCGEGRLDLDELGERIDRAFGARTGAELAPLVADLPGGRFALPGARPPRERRKSLVARMAWAAALVVLVAGLAQVAATAPLELGLSLALLVVVAVLLVELLLASLPALVLGGLVWLAVRALRGRMGLGLAPPR